MLGIPPAQRPLVDEQVQRGVHPVFQHPPLHSRKQTHQSLHRVYIPDSRNNRVICDTLTLHSGLEGVEGSGECRNEGTNDKSGDEVGGEIFPAEVLAAAGNNAPVLALVGIVAV